MVKRKRVARVPEAATLFSDAESDSETALRASVAFAHADTQFPDQENAKFPDWGRARELAFHSSGGTTHKPLYLDNATANKLASRTRRKPAKRASPSVQGEFPQALHRSWATFLQYKRAYEQRNNVRLELEEETSVAQYNSDVAGRVSGRTRGTRSSSVGSVGGEVTSELPPELKAWRRVFRCTAEDAKCAFEWTATVEFVENEWIVRVADGRFIHSHALPPADELHRARQEDTASSPVLGATTHSMLGFLQSPTAPTANEDIEIVLLLRQKQEELGCVVKEIYDELLTWEADYFLSELNNLTEYLGRLKERGDEVARLNRSANKAYVDAVGSMAYPPKTGNRDPPLYAAMQQLRGDDVAPEGVSEWLNALSATGPEAARGLERVFAIEQSAVVSDPARRSSEDINQSSTRKETSAAANPKAKTAKQRSSRSSRSAEESTAKSSSGTISSKSSAPAKEYASNASKNKATLSTAVPDGGPSRPTRRSSRASVNDNGEKVASSSSRVSHNAGSETAHGRGNVEPALSSQEGGASMHEKSRRHNVTELSIDTTPEIPAKRRRPSAAEEDLSGRSSSPPGSSAEQTLPRGQGSTSEIQDTLPPTVTKEAAAIPLTSGSQNVPRPSSARVKSRIETQLAAAISSADSRQAALPTKTVEQTPSKSKSPRQQLRSESKSLTISTSEPAPRRSRSKSPAPPAQRTPPAPPVAVTVTEKPVTSKSKSPISKDTTTTKTPISGEAATAAVAKSPKVRPPVVAVEPNTNKADKSVVTIEAWLGKMKQTASTTSSKKQKKPASSPKPEEMYSKFSRYPPLHSFRGEAPATTAQANDDDIDWNVILVPRSSRVFQQPEATQQPAVPLMQSPPPQPQLEGVLL